MAVTPGFKNEKFTHVFYFAHGGKGDASGRSYDNAAALVDADVMNIPAGCVIEKVYAVVSVAVTGTTVFEIGDDDDADGYLLDIGGSLGTPGAYGLKASERGAYGKEAYATTPAAASNASKYYAAAGKEIKLNITTASTAGEGFIVVEGFYIGR